VISQCFFCKNIWWCKSDSNLYHHSDDLLRMSFLSSNCSHWFLGNSYTIKPNLLYD
jgi:hypothetical protein